MSCCNSNFDGSDLEELEVSPYLDFDGEDMSIDEDFDYLRNPFKKAKDKKKENREETLKAKAELTSDYETCINSKPPFVFQRNWNTACKSVHPNSLSAGSNPAVDDTPADNSGSGSSSGASRRPIVGDALKKIGEEFGMPSNIGAGAGASASAEPMEEPQKAGILANKGLMIAGGVILLGLGIFAIRKFRN